MENLSFSQVLLRAKASADPVDDFGRKVGEVTGGSGGQSKTTCSKKEGLGVWMENHPHNFVD